MQLNSELKKVIKNNAFSAIATHLENGEIQNHLMWVDYKDDFLLINTEKGRKKTFNIRDNNSISLVIFEPSAMYSSWEARGRVIEIIEDETANEHIDKLSNRYTQHPYGREDGVSWGKAGIKDRELWIIEVDKLNSMVRPQAKSEPE
ncbi:MAG: pyridoxamine 5'-phosphate oxidase family protein [Candidatus Actinomarina sp.]